MASSTPSTTTVDQPETTTDTLNTLTDVDTLDADTVHDPRIIAFVKALEEKTKKAPRKWHGKTLPSEAEVKRVAGLAKAYARDTGRVFRIKKMSDPAVLAARVVPKVVREDEAAPRDARKAESK